MLEDWKWSLRYQAGFSVHTPNTTAIYNHSQWALWSVYIELVRIWALEHVYVFCSYSSVNLCIVLLERWRDGCLWRWDEYACLYLTSIFFEEALLLSPFLHGGFINVICKSMPFCFAFDLWWICCIYLVCIFVLFSICVHVYCMNLFEMLYTLMHLQLYTHTQTHTAMSCLTECSGPWLARG